MRRIIFAAMLLVSATVAFSAGTNQIPERTALMVNFTNLNFMFPTNSAGVTNFYVTNDIARQSALVAYSNALNVAMTNAQSNLPVQAHTATNAFNTHTNLSSTTNPHAITPYIIGAMSNFNGAW